MRNLSNHKVAFFTGYFIVGLHDKKPFYCSDSTHPSREIQLMNYWSSTSLDTSSLAYHINLYKGDMPKAMIRFIKWYNLNINNLKEYNEHTLQGTGSPIAQKDSPRVETTMPYKSWAITT